MAQKKKTKKKTNTKTTKKSRPMTKDFVSFYDEIIAWFAVAASIFLFLSNFGGGGAVGNMLSGLFFGVFGMIQYAVPIIILLSCLLMITNKFSSLAIKKSILCGVLITMACIVTQMLYDIDQEGVVTLFEIGSKKHLGGGMLGGCFLLLLRKGIGTVGAVIVTLFLSLISIMLITERSMIGLIKQFTANSSEQVKRVTTATTTRERPVKKRSIERKAKPREEVEEIENPVERFRREKEQAKTKDIFDLDDFPLDESVVTNDMLDVNDFSPEAVVPKRRKSGTPKEEVAVSKEESEPFVVPDTSNRKNGQNYIIPPIELLKKGKPAVKSSQTELKETAIRLQQTLKNFGVNVTITNISCGPTVTRFELQPEQGVKVSKILNLTDDIKLNLAAADIRIEAPIPGKAAIGIEVPNQKNQMVYLRDLIESYEFQKYPSKIAFAAGKDLSGKPVLADIESMPHLLIAGATGSGKSVCINTIIMSILYRADPQDVKLIMIDPKVVELSAYQGIPHLLIPVVTDPKQAAGSLNWAVSEMMERYKMFKEVQVRNFRSYNQKVEQMESEGKVGNDFKKIPQIVIIIDELADLMMVASKEVEEAIVRLTQLARAAGIHLIVATQRPSVNVITGLIKANIPSRIAFAVSSGVDSRTIIDSNGAERLLGNGDMLFFPSGYKKPVRVQGAFVSDEEVASVVGFLKEQAVVEEYKPDIEKAIAASTQKISADGGDINGRDEYFYDAASFIIDKDKASIASLQRVFKIGFNRASRLMDQLCEAGVVGEEEGTKPRKVTMSIEEFERMKEEI